MMSKWAHLLEFEILAHRLLESVLADKVITGLIKYVPIEKHILTNFKKNPLVLPCLTNKDLFNNFITKSST